MNRNIGTNPNRMLGATISADNATYGLAPARPAGPPEVPPPRAFCYVVQDDLDLDTIRAAGVEVSE